MRFKKSQISDQNPRQTILSMWAAWHSLRVSAQVLERRLQAQHMPSARTAWGLYSPYRVERRQQQAIEIDPDFAGGYKGLAWVHTTPPV